MSVIAGRQIAWRAVVATSTHEGAGIGRWSVLPVERGHGVGPVVTTATHCERAGDDVGDVGDVGVGGLGALVEWLGSASPG